MFFIFYNSNLGYLPTKSTHLSNIINNMGMYEISRVIKGSMMQKKKMKYIGAMALVSTTLLFTGCVPYNDYGYGYNNGYYGYGNPVISSTYIGIYDYPRYLDRPYYFYNNRYYYGGYYRNGYYYYRGHRYRHGHYYHRGYRYHHRRHNENVNLLRKGDRDRSHYRRDRHDKRNATRSRGHSSSHEYNRNRNVHLLRK